MTTMTMAAASDARPATALAVHPSTKTPPRQRSSITSRSRLPAPQIYPQIAAPTPKVKRMPSFSTACSSSPIRRRARPDAQQQPRTPPRTPPGTPPSVRSSTTTTALASSSSPPYAPSSPLCFRPTAVAAAEKNATPAVAGWHRRRRRPSTPPPHGAAAASTPTMATTMTTTASTAATNNEPSSTFVPASSSANANDLPNNRSSNPNNNNLVEHADRWRAMSEFAGSHRQSPSILDLSHRRLIPDVLRYGVPPQSAKSISELNFDGNSVGLHDLPKFLDGVSALFPNLKRLSFEDNPCCVVPSESAAAAAARMRRRRLVRGRGERSPPSLAHDDDSGPIDDDDDELRDDGEEGGDARDEAEGDAAASTVASTTMAATSVNGNGNGNGNGIGDGDGDGDDADDDNRRTRQRRLCPLPQPSIDALLDAADREAVRMRRLYVLYRLPDLESIDGVAVTDEERSVARPVTPNGVQVRRKGEWLTRAMAVVSSDGDEYVKDVGAELDEHDDDDERGGAHGEEIHGGNPATVEATEPQWRDGFGSRRRTIDVVDDGPLLAANDDGDDETAVEVSLCGMIRLIRSDGEERTVPSATGAGTPPRGVLSPAALASGGRRRVDPRRGSSSGPPQPSKKTSSPPKEKIGSTRGIHVDEARAAPRSAAKDGWDKLGPLLRNDDDSTPSTPRSETSLRRNVSCGPPHQVDPARSCDDDGASSDSLASPFPMQFRNDKNARSVATKQTVPEDGPNQMGSDVGSAMEEPEATTAVPSTPSRQPLMPRNNDETKAASSGAPVSPNVPSRPKSKVLAAGPSSSRQQPPSRSKNKASPRGGGSRPPPSPASILRRFPTTPRFGGKRGGGGRRVSSPRNHPRRAGAGTTGVGWRHRAREVIASSSKSVVDTEDDEDESDDEEPTDEDESSSSSEDGVAQGAVLVRK